MSDLKQDAWVQFIKTVADERNRDAAFGGRENFEQWLDVVLAKPIPTDPHTMLTVTKAALGALNSIGKFDLASAVAATAYYVLHQHGVIDDKGAVISDTPPTQEQTVYMSEQLAKVAFIALVEGVSEVASEQQLAQFGDLTHN